MYQHRAGRRPRRHRAAARGPCFATIREP